MSIETLFFTSDIGVTICNNNCTNWCISQQTIPTISPSLSCRLNICSSMYELVMCEETEVVAGDLRMEMMSLQNPVTGNTSGLTGFEKQFQVLRGSKVYLQTIIISGNSPLKSYNYLKVSRKEHVK